MPVVGHVDVGEAGDVAQLLLGEGPELVDGQVEPGQVAERLQGPGGQGEGEVCLRGAVGLQRKTEK